MPRSRCSSQQVEDLRLHRHVERAGRLVADDQPGVHRQGARDGDALALAAGELVRVAQQRIGRQADWSRAREAARARPAAGEAAHALEQDFGAAHARVERRERVLEDDLHARRSGCMPPRVDRSGRCLESDPAGGGSISLSSALPVVVLPQPDSPTSASVRPSRSSKDTPSTGFHLPDRALEDSFANREVNLQIPHPQQLLPYELLWIAASR